MAAIKFPNDFIWGVATSAAQIEGASAEDGRGYSIWDIFARIPGKIHNDILPEPANDFYHLYRSDIAGMKEMGLKSLRMSISWSRIFPEGKGKINQKGVDFYHRVFEELNKNGIMPNVTLYHWDLPQELQYELGWLNRDTSCYFGEYASFCFKEFGKEVPMFATVNEPISVYVGYGMGVFAPGIRGEKNGRQANHNILRAHGLAVQAFRAENLKNSKIGAVMDIWNKVPARPDNAEDIALAREANELTHLGYLNPMFKGKYSDFHYKWMEKNNCMPDVRQGDMEDICQPLDYFGVNCYGRTIVSKEEEEIKRSLEHAGGNIQQNGQEYYPQSVYDALMLVKNEFAGDIPLYVTENGAYKLDESLDADGKCHDKHRIDYIKGFLKEIGRAIADGADVRGYYAWTYTDNWEWTGSTQYRFGLIHCDFATQKRTWKDSAYWYRDVIKKNGFTEDPEEK